MRSAKQAGKFERRFACVEGCSNCCRRPGVVELDEDDIGRLAGFLGLSRARFEQVFVARGARRHLRFESRDRCPFLVGNERYGFCGVHEAKPTQCATYPFWPGLADDPKRWKEEASYCPGIGHGPRVPGKLVQIEMRRAMRSGCDLHC